MSLCALCSLSLHFLCLGQPCLLIPVHQHSMKQGVSVELLPMYLGAYVAGHSAIMVVEKGLTMRFQKDQVILVI